MQSLGMANNQECLILAEVLDDALRPAQVLQRIDRVMCLFLSDLTASSLPLLELVRDCTHEVRTSVCLRDPLQRRAMMSHAVSGESSCVTVALICRPVIHLEWSSEQTEGCGHTQRDLLLLSLTVTNISFGVIRCRARHVAAQLGRSGVAAAQSTAGACHVRVALLFGSHELSLGINVR